MTTETDGGRVMRMISELPPESQRRVFVTAQILRDLLERDDDNRESELAFTLVMCELADEPFTSENALKDGK
jgi:hypothetical protein